MKIIRKGINAVTSLFSNPEVPEVPKQKVAPDPDDLARRRGLRRKSQRESQAGGRESTVMTGGATKTALG